MYKKRYNVAASRARDQLWVVHSLDPGRDLKPEDLRWRLLDFARNPAGLKSHIAQAQARSESPLETAVIQRVVTAGYPVTPQFEVGGYRIDLVIGTEPKRLAVECDGDRYHTQDDLQHDLERQALLERLGWRFVRIRGGEFFRDPDLALRPLFKRIADVGINQDATLSVSSSQQDPIADELLERVRRRAADIRASWISRESAPISAEPSTAALDARSEASGRVTPRPAVLANVPREPVTFPRPSLSQPSGQNDSNRSAAADDQRRTQAASETPLAMRGPLSPSRPPKQPDVEKDDLFAIFEQDGIEYVDKRPNGGALWVVGGVELSTLMSELAERGHRFTFKESGGKATGLRPGWWLGT